MQHTFNKILVLLAIALSANLIFSCGKDCPEPAEDECSTENPCKQGYECDQGTCKCPEDGLEVQGNCIRFTEGVPTWVNRGTSCFCYDSTSISILGVGDKRTLGMPWIVSGTLGSVSTPITYYELPDGDSIHLFQMPVHCKRENQNAIIPEGFGKVLPSGDLRMRLVFKDAVTFEVVDECTTVFKRNN